MVVNPPLTLTRLAAPRMYQQRIVTGAIIAVLVLLILIILYFKLIR